MRYFFIAVMLLGLSYAHCPALQRYGEQFSAFAEEFTTEKADKMIKLLELRKEVGL